MLYYRTKVAQWDIYHHALNRNKHTCTRVGPEYQDHSFPSFCVHETFSPDKPLTLRMRKRKGVGVCAGMVARSEREINNIKRQVPRQTALANWIIIL